MAIKKLNRYEKFDVEAFLSDLTLQLKKIESYKDDETEKIKLMLSIEQDFSDKENGEDGPNRFEILYAKTDIIYSEDNVKKIRYFLGKNVELIEPVGTRWGEFRNNLSIKAKVLQLANNRKDDTN